MKLVKSLLVIVSMAWFSGCANDPHFNTKAGAGAGAIFGGIIGHEMGDGVGAAIGAASGALLGGVVGNYMDKQQREVEHALAEEQRRRELNIQRMRDNSLKITMNNEVSFDFGKSEVKPAFYPTMDRLAEVLRKYNRTVVHVIGHTDDVGSDAFNQRLSEQRAESVIGFLLSRGIQPERLRSEGRGELEPRDSNASEAGRQINRRVEIYVKPIVEGQERRAYESPRYY